jgi:membrane protease subunit HflK
MSEREPQVDRPSEVGGGADGHRERRQGVRAAAWGVVGAALIAYAASGFYVIAPDERGVVRHFGKVTGADVAPGIGYAAPWPFGRVDKVRTSEVRRVGVGFEMVEGLPLGMEAELLTGDENILVVTAIAQYRVDDPVRFLFATADPRALVRRAVRAVLVEQVGRMPVDDVLTVGKATLQREAQLGAQALLDSYGAGVRLLSADLQVVDPPQEVVQAFKDVASAKKDRERVVDEATGYQNTVVPQAKGRAQAAIVQAEGYATAVVNRAQGEAERFRLRLAEYAKAPAITRERLYLETVERVLPRMRKYVLEPARAGAPTRVRILTQD